MVDAFRIGALSVLRYVIEAYFRALAAVVGPIARLRLFGNYSRHVSTPPYTLPCGGLYSAAYAVVEKLPADELKFLIGFILCFFGGVLHGCKMWGMVDGQWIGFRATGLQEK